MKTFTPQEIVEEIVNLSEGTGRLVILSINDWGLLLGAYGGNMLIRRINDRALLIHPVREVQTRELRFIKDTPDSTSGYLEV